MKKNVIIAFLVACCLAITLFAVIPINSQGPGDYDPWYDINDDGKIDMKDIGAMARKFGTTGTPINKTALLLELEQNITVLREEMIALQLWVGRTVVDMIYDLNETIEQRVPQHPIISIPAAAFMPYFSDDFPPEHMRNHGRYLSNYDSTQYGNYNAPVQLPHGVNVTRVYIFWYDVGVGSVEGRLIKATANHTLDGYMEMAYLESPSKDGPGWGSSNTNIIEDSIIDNYYQYFFRVAIPASNIMLPHYYFYYAIIEYEYPE